MTLNVLAELVDALRPTNNQLARYVLMHLRIARSFVVKLEELQAEKADKKE